MSTMTLQEIQSLASAMLDGNGVAICAHCVPIMGDRAPYYRDTGKAPRLVVDPRMPIVATCPKCSVAFQTPAATAIAMLCERLRELEKQHPAPGELPAW